MSNELTKNLHQKGAKDDSDKPRLDLVLGDFATALWGVGLVGTFGANKYTDRGWVEVNNPIERYLSALLRHYFNFKSGEIDDKESGLPHLAHLAWNALAVLELWMKQNSIAEVEVGDIVEVNSSHPDFKPIRSELTVDPDETKPLCCYKYDCDYKETC